MYPKMLQAQSAFTLLELMLVISIISLLAAIAMPQYQSYYKRAKVAEGLYLSMGISTSVADYYAYTGRLPVDNTQAEIPPKALLKGRYVDAIEVDNGALHIHFEQSLELGTLSLRPAIVAAYPPSGNLVWVCGYANAAPSMTVLGANKTTIDHSLLPDNCY